MASTKYQIQEGPGRYELERGLFDGKPMTFTCSDSDCDCMIVDSMECIDERRNGLWLIKGHRPDFTEYGSRVNPFTFTTRYHVGRRKGEIEIDMPTVR